MRVLTVRQPWAWAIIHGGKDVENRTRNIAGAYRGPVAIHAAKAYDLDAWAALARADLPAWGRAMAAREALLSGAVLGVVELVDSHVGRLSHTDTHLGQPVCFDGSTPIGSSCSPWAMPHHHHLVLANPRALYTPVPARGRLGLWRPDAQLLDAIDEQLGVQALASARGGVS